ncbi:MAG: zinc ribbon domain-containing protein [Clostridia bacterium]|nr:zinc ribbon domain-containing protein [Clostridia bacterium]
MNLIDEKRKLRTIFQAFIVIVMALYLLNLELPSNFNGKSIMLLVLTIISCVGLLWIIIRVNCKNVRRWEMVLYYALNIIFVILIVYCVLQLSYIAADVARDNIPYAEGTEEYYNAYDDAEGIDLSAAFAFILLGIPSIIMTIIFAIVGITLTCTQGNSTVQPIQANSTIVEPQQNASVNTANTTRLNYCKYCGKKVDDDTIFCKHCGNKLR